MIQFHLDPTRGIRLVQFSGNVGDQELLETYQRVVQLPEFNLAEDSIIDLTKLEKMEVTSLGVRKLVELLANVPKTSPAGRVAIVAPSDLQFGMARMYQMLRGEEGGEIQVFRNRAIALNWLVALKKEEASGVDFANPLARSERPD